MNYDTSVFWLVTSYKGIDVTGTSEWRDEASTIVSRCQDQISSIETNLKGSFNLENGELIFINSAVQFPDFEFGATNEKGEREYVAKIKIKPRIAFENDKEYASNTEVSILSKVQGMEVGNFNTNFSEIVQYAKAIEDIVKDAYLPSIEGRDINHCGQTHVKLAGLDMDVDSVLYGVLTGKYGGKDISLRLGAKAVLNDILMEINDGRVLIDELRSDFFDIRYNDESSDHHLACNGTIKEGNNYIAGISNVTNNETLHQMFQLTVDGWEHSFL